MPAVAAQYSIADRDVNEAGDAERKERVAAYNKARGYYLGNHAKQIKVKPGQPDVNVTFNLVGRAIDAMVAFMGLPRFEVGGRVEREPNEAGLLEVEVAPGQAALDALWEMNNLPMLLVDAALSTALAGHGYVRLIGGGDLPGVGLLDPRFVTVFWDMEDVRRVLWYRLDWRRGKADRRQDIVRGELVGSSGWLIIEYERGGSVVGGEWREVGRDLWPWDFSPIVDWKNQPNPHEFYGRDDVLAAAALNDAANFVGSNINKILKHHAGPKTVVTGGKLPPTLDSSPDAILEITQPEARVFNLEMHGDLGAALEYFHLLRASFFEQMRVVDKSGIREKLGNLTNFGLRVMYGDQVDAIGMKRRLIGAALREVSRRALAMMGMAGDVVTVWDDPLPVNRLELVQAVAMEHGIGATSAQTLLETMGRDPAVESERRGDEVNRAGDLLAETLTGLGQRGLM